MLEVVEPKKFVEKDVTKLSQDELSKYHTIVAKNILYMVNSSISGEQLEYSRRVNNSCCLTNVADGLNNLSFYFTYFENLLKDNVKLQKLLVISDEIEKQKQTIK